MEKPCDNPFLLRRELFVMLAFSSSRENNDIDNGNKYTTTSAQRHVRNIAVGCLLFWELQCCPFIEEKDP
jgi:hypothetical protein